MAIPGPNPLKTKTQRPHRRTGASRSERRGVGPYEELDKNIDNREYSCEELSQRMIREGLSEPVLTSVMRFIESSSIKESLQLFQAILSHTAGLIEIGNNTWKVPSDNTSKNNRVNIKDFEKVWSSLSDKLFYSQRGKIPLLKKALDITSEAPGVPYKLRVSASAFFLLKSVVIASKNKREDTYSLMIRKMKAAEEQGRLSAINEARADKKNTSSYGLKLARDSAAKCISIIRADNNLREDYLGHAEALAKDLANVEQKDLKKLSLQVVNDLKAGPQELISAISFLQESCEIDTQVKITILKANSAHKYEILSSAEFYDFYSSCMDKLEIHEHKNILGDKYTKQFASKALQRIVPDPEKISWNEFREFLLLSTQIESIELLNQTWSRVLDGIPWLDELNVRGKPQTIFNGSEILNSVKDNEQIVFSAETLAKYLVQMQSTESDCILRQVLSLEAEDEKGEITHEGQVVRDFLLKEVKSKCWPIVDLDKLDALIKDGYLDATKPRDVSRLKSLYQVDFLPSHIQRSALDQGAKLLYKNQANAEDFENFLKPFAKRPWFENSVERKKIPTEHFWNKLLRMRSSHSQDGSKSYDEIAHFEAKMYRMYFNTEGFPLTTFARIANSLIKSCLPIVAHSVTDALYRFGFQRKTKGIWARTCRAGLHDLATLTQVEDIPLKFIRSAILPSVKAIDRTTDPVRACYGMFKALSISGWKPEFKGIGQKLFPARTGAEKFTDEHVKRFLKDLADTPAYLSSENKFVEYLIPESNKSSVEENATSERLRVALLSKLYSKTNGQIWNKNLGLLGKALEKNPWGNHHALIWKNLFPYISDADVRERCLASLLTSNDHGAKKKDKESVFLDYVTSTTHKSLKIPPPKLSAIRRVLNRVSDKDLVASLWSIAILDSRIEPKGKIELLNILCESKTLRPENQCKLIEKTLESCKSNLTLTGNPLRRAAIEVVAIHGNQSSIAWGLISQAMRTEIQGITLNTLRERPADQDGYKKPHEIGNSKFIPRMSAPEHLIRRVLAIANDFGDKGTRALVGLHRDGLFNDMIKILIGDESQSIKTAPQGQLHYIKVDEISESIFDILLSHPQDLPTSICTETPRSFPLVNAPSRIPNRLPRKVTSQKMVIIGDNPSSNIAARTRKFYGFPKESTIIVNNRAAQVELVKKDPSSYAKKVQGLVSKINYDNTNERYEITVEGQDTPITCESYLITDKQLEVLHSDKLPIKGRMDPHFIRTSFIHSKEDLTLDILKRIASNGEKLLIVDEFLDQKETFAILDMIFEARMSHINIEPILVTRVPVTSLENPDTFVKFKGLQFNPIIVDHKTGRGARKVNLERIKFLLRMTVNQGLVAPLTKDWSVTYRDSNLIAKINTLESHKDRIEIVNPHIVIPGSKKVSPDLLSKLAIDIDPISSEPNYNPLSGRANTTISDKDKGRAYLMGDALFGLEESSLSAPADLMSQALTIVASEIVAAYVRRS